MQSIEWKPGVKVRRNQKSHDEESFGVMGKLYTLKSKRGGLDINEWTTEEGIRAHPIFFEAVPTPIPLYSEKEAVAFLTEKGYEVKAPPGPLKGQFVVVMTPSGNPHAIARDRYDKNDYSLLVTAVLAIVDWTEGQGI